jgi:methyl-accepting chemotaxis protein
MSTSAKVSASSHLIERARRTHRVPLLATWLSFLLALGLGYQSNQLLLALIVSGALAGGFTAMTQAAPTSRVTSSMAGFVLLSQVGLHIHLARGATEIHFGVFALLAALVVYRDWLPVVVGATTIAVHHAAFLWMQLNGWGVYCFTQPSLVQLIEHAAYVVVEAGLLVYLAEQMRADERRHLDVEALIDAVVIEEHRVDLSGVARRTVRASQARKLQDLLGRIQGLVSTLGESISSISLATREIATGNQDLSGRTEQTASSLQQAASSLETLTHTVRQTADSARMLAVVQQLVDRLVDVGQRGVRLGLLEAVQRPGFQRRASSFRC